MSVDDCSMAGEARNTSIWASLGDNTVKHRYPKPDSEGKGGQGAGGRYKVTDNFWEERKDYSTVAHKTLVSLLISFLHSRLEAARSLTGVRGVQYLRPRIPAVWRISGLITETKGQTPEVNSPFGVATHCSLLKEIGGRDFPTRVERKK